MIGERYAPLSAAQMFSKGRRTGVARIVAAGAIAFEEAGEQLAVAAVPPGAQALGSALDAPDRSVNCRGEEPATAAPACSNDPRKCSTGAT